MLESSSLQFVYDQNHEWLYLKPLAVRHGRTGSVRSRQRGYESLYGVAPWGWGADGGWQGQGVWRHAVWWAGEYLKKWKLKFAKSEFSKRIFEILREAHRSPNI